MSVTEYEKSIIESIISTASIKIDTVSEMEDLGTFDYNEENFNSICGALQNREYSKLRKNELGSKSFDDITVIRFKNGKGDIFYAVIYDSWALEQDPKVLRIYPLILPFV